MAEKINSPADSKNDKALKSGIWYTISSVATKAVLVITTPIYTRLLTTSDYGIASTFSSWYTLLLTVFSLNLAYSIGRAKIDYPDKLEQYTGSMYTVSAIFSLCVSAVMIIFRKPLSSVMELSPNLIIILCIYLCFAPAINLKQAKYKYQYRYKGNIAITAYTTFATIIFTFIFIFVFNNQRYYGKVLGATVPTVMLSIVFWFMLIKKRYITFNREYWKYGLQISAPLILHTISLNILAQSDRILITKYVGSDMTGIYTLAYQYAILINVILDSVNQAWLPWFHDTYAVNDFKAIRETMKPLILLGCFIGIGCISLAPEAVLILGGKAYIQGKWVVAPLVLGIVCRFIFMQYEHIELHLKKTKYTAIGTIIAAVINLILNIIFIPKFGFIAAAFTTLFTYFVLMNIHHFITRVFLKTNFYAHKFLYLCFFATTGIAAIFMCLYDYLIIRIMLLAVIAGVYIWHERKWVFGLVKKKKFK